MQLRNVISIISGLFLLGLTQVQGASFDCMKANNSIEKAICASERVSKLDSDLGTAYRKAIESAKDPTVLSATQRAWIKERNTCQDEACLVAAYERRIDALVPAPAPTTKAQVASTTLATKSSSTESESAISPSNQIDDSRDLIAFFKRGSSLAIVSSIDGSKRISDPAQLLHAGYRICVLEEDPYTHVSTDMLSLSRTDFLRISQDQIRRLVDKAAGGAVSQVTAVSCGSGGRLAYPYPEVLALPRAVFSSLKNTAILVYDIQEKYDSALVIRHSELVQAANQFKLLQQRAVNVAQQRSKHLDDLAANDNRDYVASVTLANPNNSDLRYCTLAYSGASGAAILGYVFRGTELLSPAYRARVEEVGAKSTGASVSHKGFASLDNFYQQYQQKSIACNVYVDFPKNVKMLITAIERDKGASKLELNEIVVAQDLRETWARHNGYADWRANEFADAIGASAEQVRALAAYGISTSSTVAASLAEMKSTGHTNSDKVSDLLIYLADKKSAGKSQTAVSVKRDRERAESYAAEQSKVQARLKEAEYAKQFPYTATISCGMGGRHMNIQACFAGQHVNTQLEIRNGNDYKMLQVWEIGQAFGQSTEGLVIPLRETFEIKAQNSDKTMILTLRIKENSTGRIVYEKAAPQFGVVSVRR